MHAIERELIKVTGYKLQRPFANRQDYLGSILNAVMKLTDSDFDDLSDEAASWANAAVEAKNSKDEELPDFDEAPVDDEAEEAEETSEDDSETDDDDEGDADHDPETGEVIEPDDEEGDAEPDEETPEPKKSYRKPPKEKKAEKVKPSAKPATKKPPAEEDVVLDKWGCMEGSKNSQALAMFEKGATTKEVKDKIGGTYYNILGKAVQNGHKMEKDGALIKLTHKDDLGGKKPVKKKK